VLKRVLVANRGEIAVRVIRTCREMGIETVGVYSKPDRNALHIVYANRAYELPGVTAAETYLNIPLLLDIAKKSGCDSVHPGYGFLAENADFASACRDAGIIFIGPSPESIIALGHKVQAKRTMASVGIPVIPGSEKALFKAEEAEEEAARVGYPILLKAAAGGGGRGMRVVNAKADLAKSFRSAQSEAKAAFGSDEIFIERYIANPKHIEFQILADKRGNTVHLGERECSIQRRYQKLIEEAPSAALTPEMRAEMGAMAVKAARAANYENAGTVEFLLDGDKYYFMEMNTRLQVEHPVTEMITATDLVKGQILIAGDEPLPLKQEDVLIRGWSFEARINAEDPLRDFAPSYGKINRYLPPMGNGVRVDSAAYEGYTIPMEYDSLAGKLIVFGRDREIAVQKMIRALDEFIITGVKTTIPFHRLVFEHPVFLAGTHTTRFVEDEYNPTKLKEILSRPREQETVKRVAIAAALAYYLERSKIITSSGGDRAVASNWERVNRLRDATYL
jgi:acetyl-CoA carboxylase biotin carboxylase subunit